MDLYIVWEEFYNNSKRYKDMWAIRLSYKNAQAVEEMLKSKYNDRIFFIEKYTAGA